MWHIVCLILNEKIVNQKSDRKELLSNINNLNTMGSIFDETMELVAKATEGAQIRHKVISSNVANADTPGYKAFDIDFQKELKKALKKTRQINLDQMQKIEWAKFELKPSKDAEPRIDGNTVDLGHQLVEMNKNVVLHNLFIRALSAKIKILQTAVNEKL